MKKRACGMVGLVLIWPHLWAQGILDFENRTSEGDFPVYMPDCVTPVAGDAFRAQLYAGPAGAAESALVPVPPGVQFLTGARAGQWLPTSVTVPFVPPGQTATVQVRVFQADAGSYENAVRSGELHGTSELLDIVLNKNSEPGGPPADLRGLRSFCLVPEPPGWALAALGAALLCSFAYMRSKS